jgi:hypothetical protein
MSIITTLVSELAWIALIREGGSAAEVIKLLIDTMRKSEEIPAGSNETYCSWLEQIVSHMSQIDENLKVQNLRLEKFDNPAEFRKLVGEGIAAAEQTLVQTQRNMIFRATASRLNPLAGDRAVREAMWRILGRLYAMHIYVLMEMGKGGIRIGLDNRFQARTHHDSDTWKTIEKWDNKSHRILYEATLKDLCSPGIGLTSESQVTTRRDDGAVCGGVEWRLTEFGYAFLAFCSTQNLEVRGS